MRGAVLGVAYEPVVEGYGYVRPEVMLEFGATSTGEPCETMAVSCDAAGHIPLLSLPTAAS